MFPSPVDLAELALVDVLELAFEFGDALRLTRRRSISSCFSPVPRVPMPPTLRPPSRRPPGDRIQVPPHPGQPRIGVFELGQFDLELGLAGLGAGGEDVQDQFAAVDDLGLDDLFEFADLAGRQVVVEDDDVGLVLDDAVPKLFGLAAADVGGGVNLAEFLLEPADDDRPGRLGQGRQLGQIVRPTGLVGGLIGPDEDGQFPFYGQLLSTIIQLGVCLRKKSRIYIIISGSGENLNGNAVFSSSKGTRQIISGDWGRGCRGLSSPCGLADHQRRKLLRPDMTHVFFDAASVAGIQVHFETLDLPVKLDSFSSSKPAEHAFLS